MMDTLAPSEKHLEDWIVANQKEFFSLTPAIWGRRIVARQVEIASGRIDLVIAGKLGLRIVELKKGVVDGNAVAQLIRYVGEIQDLFNWAECHTTGLDDPHWYDPSTIDSSCPVVSGFLIGNEYDHKALLACATNRIVTYRYDCYEDGYDFEEVSADFSVEYRKAMETDLGAAIKEVLRHRRLFTEDREALLTIFREEGSL